MTWKEKLQYPFKQYLKSFDTSDNGWSRKKCVAFELGILIALAEIKMIYSTNFDKFFEFIINTNLIAIGLLLGIITVAQLLTLKMSSSSNTNATKDTTTDTTMKIGEVKTTSETTTPQQ